MVIGEPVIYLDIDRIEEIAAEIGVQPEGVLAATVTHEMSHALREHPRGIQIDPHMGGIARETPSGTPGASPQSSLRRGSETSPFLPGRLRCAPLTPSRLHTASSADENPTGSSYGAISRERRAGYQVGSSENWQSSCPSR